MLMDDKFHQDLNPRFLTRIWNRYSLGTIVRESEFSKRKLTAGNPLSTLQECKKRKHNEASLYYHAPTKLNCCYYLNGG